MKIKFLKDNLFQNNTKEPIDLMATYNYYYGQLQETKKYVLRKSILSCNMGTQLSRIDVPNDHGIIPPVVLASDWSVHININSFGYCKCKSQTPNLPKRLLDSSGYKCNPILASGWHQNRGNTRIWNEEIEKYEDIVNDSASLICLYGGVITVAEVFKEVLNSQLEAFLCLHGDKIALVDVLHPMCKSILNESQVIANINNEEMLLVVEPENISTNMPTVNSKIFNGYEEKSEKKEPIERQQVIMGSIIDNINSARNKNWLPEENKVTKLAEQYLRAGGDSAGITIGVIWALGLSPDASEEDHIHLRNLGVINENEKIGRCKFEGDGYWLRFFLRGIVFPEGNYWRVNWKKYMESNPILSGKVGDVVIPIGYSLKNEEKKEISMEISMIIENGGGYTGYEFLHGTDEKVGGFQINGTVSKNKNGDTTYELTYRWNDIINPEIERYSDDAERTQIAEGFLNPKSYIISIIWTDTTKIKASEKQNKGWLASWSSNWSNTMSEYYKNEFTISENEQLQEAFGGKNWNQRLQEIKMNYPDYYN